MPTRNTNVEGLNSTRISGAQADVTVQSTPGVLARIHIEVAGDATSGVTLYDGAITGTAIGFVDGTAIRESERFMWCSTSIHAVTVNPDTNMRVVITHL